MSVSKTNKAYRFSHWTEGGTDVYQKTYSFDETFGETDRELTCLAHFGKRTGLILHSASSGVILRGSNGKILRDD